MKKTFDCVEMKRKIQEEMWIEAGETMEGLVALIKETSKNNPLWNKLIERKEKLSNSSGQ